MIWWRVSKSKLESFIWCQVIRGCLTNLRSDWLWLCFKSKWDKKRESHSHSHLPVIKSSASIGGWTGLTLPSHFCPGPTSVNISEMCRPASLLLLLLSSLVTRWAGLAVLTSLLFHFNSSQNPDQSSGLVEKLISQRNTLIQPGISIKYNQK